jgi:molybdopterin-guanine dinucleotide biosynthesis protein A
MGLDKRFLKVAGQRTFDRTLKVLEELFAETIVVLAEPIAALDVKGCRVVYDAIPNTGSLGGLYTGLITSSHQQAFAVACDMPYLNSDVIRFMSSFDITADVVVAKLSGRFQALHALYTKRCVPILKEMAERKDLKLQRLFCDEALRISIVQERDLTAIDSGLRSFQNINTPEDLASAEGATSG